MNQVYNLQKGINYTTIYTILKFNINRVWALFPQIKPLILNDNPIAERYNELSEILKINKEELSDIYSTVENVFKKVPFQYHIVTIEDRNYSEYLKASLNPPIVLFTRGNNDLMNLPSVSIVGTRNPSEKGSLRARNIAILVSDMGFGVTSGLAKGIDTAAHLGSISSGGQTIAVIGTNLSESYPKENYDLQEKIAKDYLLISQFPFNQPTQVYNFPQRNQTMSGLTRATIIVEAGETSGALIQAEQCLRQKRKLFILKNLLENTKLNWPKKYVGKDGVFVVTKIGDLISELEKFCLINEPKRPIGDLNASLFENGL